MLHHAIRASRFGGAICVLSYYGGDSAGLRLGEEFPINRLDMLLEFARHGTEPKANFA